MQEKWLKELSKPKTEKFFIPENRFLRREILLDTEINTTADDLDKFFNEQSKKALT